MKRAKDTEQGKVCKRTTIGGQAVLEGVMMRGPSSMATAVRAPSGDITIETSRLPKKKVWSKIPFVRGVFAFIDSLYSGTKTILRTAEVYGDFTEPSKFEIWMEKKLHVNAMNLIMGFSVVLGLALAIFLFTIVPSLIVSALDNIPSFVALPQHETIKSVIQGCLKLTIFVLYIFAVSNVKDIKRLFRYHGAEHKTISCYERGLELTVENARTMRTEHSRCGTAFMFFVMAVSIFVLSIVSWLIYGLAGFEATGSAAKVINALVRVGMSLATLPVVAGISYELLKLLSKSDNLLCRVLRSPGMLMQKLTTKEPDDSMLEVAIAAFTRVMAMEADPTLPDEKFDIKIPYVFARRQVERYLGEGAEQAEADWIIVEVSGVTRSELPTLKTLTQPQLDRATEIAKRCGNGEPLQYVLGYTEFYGLKLNVNSAVLVPRPETELLAEAVIKQLREGDTVLDLCTGSGAIALAVKKNSEAIVTACDVSNAALAVARSNALLNGLEVEFAQGDLWSAVEGRRFDVVVSNPPYIKTADIAGLDKNVKDFEPMLALDGGADGLDFYRRIAERAKAFVAEGGVLLLEVGAGQAQDVAALFDQPVEIIKDYSEVERIVKVCF